jgi:Flp pilus assembly protein TadD
MRKRVENMPKQQRVEMEFLEALRKRCPKYTPVLEALGHIYTRAGRYAEGLQIDAELTDLRPNEPENWYNLACSYALTGQTDYAFDALDRAVALGYNDVDWIMKDKDLKPLHADPRFKKILGRLS